VLHIYIYVYIYIYDISSVRVNKLSILPAQWVFVFCVVRYVAFTGYASLG